MKKTRLEDVVGLIHSDDILVYNDKQRLVACRLGGVSTEMEKAQKLVVTSIMKSKYSIVIYVEDTKNVSI